ncbi:MAG: 2-oxoglutarate ferredoxin oxidoreductase subunit alpha, partial [Acidobacteria bacterium]|nr:2-oxoglutarate ferredoxin oxidoreductase subunit alpha [Acidobacteriota bacterium]
HRIGGIEKEDGSGNISYEPGNHERMIRLRAAKIAGIAKTIAPLEVEGDADADLLVLGWGSTWGAIGAAVDTVRSEGHRVARAHLVHLNPMPANLGEILKGRKKILVPEMNLGQLTKLVRAEFLVDATCISKVQGQPFTGGELSAHILDALKEIS